MVSIIIVHYKVEKELFECIDSIQKLEDKIKNEIIVVDNDEAKTIEKKLRKKFPKVKYIKSPSNIGFGAGNNLGAKFALGEYFFFLNPDTRITKNAIGILHAFINRSKEVGIVAPAFIKNDGSFYKLQGSDKFSLLSGIVVLSFVNKVFPNNFISRKFLHLDWKKDKAEEVGVVPGTAFMIRKSDFEKIGGFDKKLFLYFEEYDIAHRIKKLRLKNYIIPQAKVYHISGASTKKRSDIQKIFSQSRFYFFKKHYGILIALFITFVTSIGKKQLVSILIAFFLLVLLLFYHTRGIVFYDEGYIVNGANRFLNGELPYKDFHFVYTPGTIYLVATAFLLFGKSILAERIMAAITSFIAIVFLYLLLRYMFKKKIYAFIGVLFFISWGISHVNFIWPVMQAIMTGIITCYFFSRGVEEKKKTFLIIAGATTVLTFIFKQNFGLVMLANSLITFLLIKKARKREHFLFYVYGLILSVMPFTIYLSLNNSILPFLDDLYVYTYKRIIIYRDIDSLFIYGGTIFWLLYRAAIYLFPLYVSIPALLWTLKKKSEYFYSINFVLLFYISGIRPTTDYVHIVPLIAISAVSIVALLAFIRNKVINNFIYFGVIILIICGFYTSIFNGYYRYEPRFIENYIFNSLPRVKIWLNFRDNRDIIEINKFISNNIKKSDNIYVNGYFPMWYFLTNKSNPTPYDLISFSQFHEKEREQIVEILKKKKVQIVLSKKDTTNIMHFIKNYYKPIKEVNDYVIWKINY